MQKIKRAIKRTVSALAKTKTVEASGLKISGSFCDYGALRAISANRFEPFFTELFKKSLRPGDRFADVGAHIGYYSTLGAQLVGPNGHVDAFEPHPRNRHFLEANLRVNGMLEVAVVHSCAVSDRVGNFIFYADLLQSDFSSLTPSLGSDDVQEIVVETLPLDQVYDQEQKLHCLKIDVEGHEAKVLKGASATIERSVKSGEPFTIFLECNPEALKACEVAPRELIDLVESYGLKVSIIDESTKSLLEIPRDGCQIICNLIGRASKA